ncbi:MAG: hypothetical protein HC789_08560 [Microcoleus sp. CSU_2_2]|nr:hypothetical protein [Microcoleus sp. SU_5_3]NJS10417.1 hypothetical protein [Microcoleus sp. CSU_2_2]
MVLHSDTNKFNNSKGESIHAPGSIQLHGILFVLQEPLLKIIQVSKNTVEVLGIQPQEILGKFFTELVGIEQIASIEAALSETNESITPISLYIQTPKDKLFFNGTIYRSDESIIIELEPLVSQQYQKELSFYNLIKFPITKIQAAHSLQEMYQIVVTEVRKLIGFDRVMIYQFDTEYGGEVVAEDKVKSLNTLWGLHYPDSDIPKLAQYFASKI